jgi:hypothetical protein
MLMPTPHVTHGPSAVLYAHVSSKAQEKEGVSILAQLELLRTSHADAPGTRLAATASCWTAASR